MTDLEDRLTDALRRGADHAPYAAGLADGARRRVRARRRHRAAAGGVAAALVLAAATGLAVAGARQDASPTTSSKGTAVRAADAGYRWESWHGVSVQVPRSWGYFHGDGCSKVPLVARPDGVDWDVGCGRASHSLAIGGYGLRFSAATKPGLDWPVALQSGDGFPQGTYVGTRDLAGVFIEVGTPSAALSQRILNSVVVNDVDDPNGCPVAFSGQRSSVTSGTVSVCRYGDDGELRQSETLTGDDATSARRALDSAEVDARRGDACTPDPTSDLARVRMWFGEEAFLVSFGDDCWSDNRMVAPDGSSHRLSERMLYWAISPGWSTSFDSALDPLPQPLRGVSSPAAG